MSDTASQNHTFRFLDKVQLIKLRRKAMRVGVWFRALQRIDRALVDLTIKVTTSIRSPSLAKSIMSIAGKLEEYLESKFLRAVRRIGHPLAQKVSLFAQQWGNKTAKNWANDEDFARYWTAMKLNGQTYKS